jgi:hypothetical protein
LKKRDYILEEKNNSRLYFYKRMLTTFFQFKRGLGLEQETWGSGFHFAGDWRLDDNMFLWF